MKETSAHKYGRWFMTLLLTVVGVLGVVVVLPRLLNLFIPFVIAWILALIVSPLVRFFEKRLHIRKKFGSIIVIVLVLAVIVVLLYLLISALAGEVMAFIPHIPDYAQSLLSLLGQAVNWLSSVMGNLPEGMGGSLDNLAASVRDQVLTWVTNFSGSLAAGIGSVALSLPNAFFYIVITVISSFLLVAQRERLWNAFYMKMPPTVKNFIDMGRSSVKKALGGYFMGQMKISWGVGLASLIGLLLIGTDYALLLSILIAIADFLPVIGNGTILLPWALIELTSGNYMRALWLVVLYAGGQIVRGLLQPKVLGSTMGLPPLLTTLFIYIGFRFFGIGGMIFAVPIGMVAVEICRYGVFNPALGVLREMAVAVTALLKKPGAAKPVPKAESSGQIPAPPEEEKPSEGEAPSQG